ncbi:MAG: hypothetical protein LAO79_18105, partial [Acidobacteriia bacterium]|nr:hypothetical protein [Terriglobia bacterium]
HNATDILTLACLAGIVPYAFKDPAKASLKRGTLKHGAEMAGIARWLREAGELEQALVLFRRAIEAGLKDDLLFRTMWDIGMLERRMGRSPLETWTNLASCRNDYRVKALEELAKHYEHREKDYVRALEITREARELGDSEEWKRREERLGRRFTQMNADRKKRRR